MTMREIHFEIRLRVRGQGVPPDGIEFQRCMVCDSRLSIHQPDPDDPQRLLAHCTSPECGVWCTMILATDDKVSYLIRLPSIVEMTEAIARWKSSDGHADGDGR